MASRDPAVDYLLELLAPLGGVDARRMFGGWGLRAGGLMIGFVSGEVLYLKVDARTQAAFEAAGSAALVYAMKDRSLTMRYWSVPDEAMDSPEAMLPWARLALDAALRGAAAKPVRKSVRKSSDRSTGAAPQLDSSAVAPPARVGDSQQCEPSARRPSAVKRRR
jgi:DNA transformation protein